jgi:hypothetical protein
MPPRWGLPLFGSPVLSEELSFSMLVLSGNAVGIAGGISVSFLRGGLLPGPDPFKPFMPFLPPFRRGD